MSKPKPRYRIYFCGTEGEISKDAMKLIVKTYSYRIFHQNSNINIVVAKVP